MPKTWTKWQRTTEDMLEEQKEKIKFENSLLIEKRPYFMRYLYGNYNLEYKNYVDNFDNICQLKFGCDLEDVPKDIENTPKFIKFKERFNRYSKFLMTDGVMNKVCHYMESRCQDIKFKLKNNSNQDYIKLYMNNTIEITNEKIKVMTDKYNEYMKRKNSKEEKGEKDTVSFDSYCNNLRDEMFEISIDKSEVATLAVYVCYILNPNKPKDFAWDICGDGIVENIMNNTNGQIINIPRLNKNGDIKYLGKNYSVESVGIDNEQDIV